MANSTYEAIERKALEMIEAAGEEGILQSELIKRLEIDSRTGSRLVIRLAKRGIIQKTKVVVNGKTTYRLVLSRKKPAAVNIVVNVSSILEIPCATCKFRGECGPGNLHNPATCRLLDSWLRRVAGLGAGNGAAVRALPGP